MKNCKLFIEENTEDDKRIRMDLFLTRKTFDWGKSHFWYHLDGNALVLEAKSIKTELKNCHINLRIPISYRFQRLKIDCEEDCVVVSNLPKMEVEKTEMNGRNKLFLNLR